MEHDIRWNHFRFVYFEHVLSPLYDASAFCVICRVCSDSFGEWGRHVCARLHGKDICSHSNTIRPFWRIGSTLLSRNTFKFVSKSERESATKILCLFGADVDLQDRNGWTALHLAKDVVCVCLILAYHGDPSIETVFGKTALVTAAENQRLDICRMPCDAQAVMSLGALGRGSNLFCTISRDTQAWLMECSRNVRQLSHLCRCVIRNQLKLNYKNIFQGVKRLPLPTPLKTYVSLIMKDQILKWQINNILFIPFPYIFKSWSAAIFNGPLLHHGI